MARPSLPAFHVGLKPVDENGQLRSYFNCLESRAGYRLILGGTRHFGYWERDTWWPFPLWRALRRMEDKLAEALALSPKAQVLDAGCGVGHVAIWLSTQHDLQLTGVDIIDHHVTKAQHNIAKSDLDDTVVIRKMDYHDLDQFEACQFDGVYTMETLMHARQPEVALRQFCRVLKPGGRIAMFEYEHDNMECQPKNFFNSEVSKGLDKIYHYGSLPTFARAYPGELKKLLEEAGFVNIQVRDYSNNILPMTRFFFALALFPYLIVRLFRLERYFINTVAGVGVYVARRHWRYLAVSATKPDSSLGGMATNALLPTKS
ncbi:S-adenosyl-L-methionine-dependent Diels-Alderase iccD [Paramyrothecium foliicola]|nr:S-adenosyl-L-methionine-dependent Diels-Alderase iccD [Paramyrothecium foliicola]